ncbi:hypothetical protein CC2G_011538 [Coprinopsis cinerea AmutBmut pab1-1]|nr:hypothetical protein CC2G_011538 [Coprinopsis cinerea AmutBmut pab1-1]
MSGWVYPLDKDEFSVRWLRVPIKMRAMEEGREDIGACMWQEASERALSDVFDDERDDRRWKGHGGPAASSGARVIFLVKLSGDMFSATAYRGQIRRRGGWKGS